ncbi:MAG: tetrathionate reductase subunit TtrA [Desulfitobacterium sp.]|nr:tetrathionate reductase subunit TtrA [Desulfitobacterium sp.]
MNRRDFLKSMALVGSVAAIGLGIDKLPQVIADEAITNPTPYDGDALPVEMKIDKNTGEITFNKDIALKTSVCLGCWSNCGNRVKVDKKTGKILRVVGNPYHPSCAEPHLPYDTPLKDSYLSLGQYGEKGHIQRATVCQRGNSAFQMVYEPNRILTPLKRAGKRGEGKWKPITWEEALEETIEGGQLFAELGENQTIEGFRQVRDLETPIYPDEPEWGVKANQFVFIGGRDDGRTPFAKRFVTRAFGSPNHFGHGGICGLSRRIAYLAFLDTWDSKPHMKADYMGSEFVMFFGNAPGHAGAPFQPMARKSALAQAEKSMKAVIVDPVLQNGMYNSPKSEESSWVPIRPGGDGALAMAMVRWAIENKKYNEDFLSSTTKEAAQKKKYPSWTNATYLVIQEEGHPNYGKFLLGEQIGLADGPNEETPNYVVLDENTGELALYNATDKGTLFYSGKVKIGDQEVLVKTSMEILKDEANSFTYEEYAQESGLTVERIIGLAKEYFSHGTKAATDHHGGVSMHSNGFYGSLAVITLNALNGNINKKGGSTKSGGGYTAIGNGARYNFGKIPGGVQPQGFPISRESKAYEDTPEYKKKVARGENPYPATLPWTPLADSLEGHVIPSMMAGYPYPAKILMMWMANPFYATPGLFREDVENFIKDPKNIPLIISIDVMMGDSTQYADYIIPDTTFYESWGVPTIWNLVLTKAIGTRRPVIEPLVPKTKDGHPYSMETYFIEMARRLGLSGYGDKALVDAKDNVKSVECAADFFLKAMANIAFDGEPVPDISPEELALSGLEEDMKEYKSYLTDEEWKKVYYLLARGGRFEDYEKNYEGDNLTNKFGKIVNIYNERLGTSIDSFTGKRNPGTASWRPPTFADGRTVDEVYPEKEWPFIAVSYKPRYRTGAYLDNVPLLKSLQDTNYIEMNMEDAQALGISTGDRVKLITPTGEVEGTVKVRRGVGKGSIGIEYGYGHWGNSGSKGFEVDGKKFGGGPRDGKGILLNHLALRDISLKTPHPLSDLVGGSNDRNTVKAKIVKL